MEKDLISVIIISYNIEKYISKCIKSVEKQDYTNLEIIVVDDGSTDETPKIIQSMASEDSRLRFFCKENGGPSSARNYGLDVSKGKYVLFVDGDDYVAKDYVSYLYKLIINNNSEFAFSRNLFSSKKQQQITEDKIKVLTPEQATALLMSTTVVVSSYNKIYSSSLLNKHKIRYNEKLFYGEGLSFITTVSQLANNVCVGDRRVYFYRKNNYDSATTAFNIQKIINGEKSIFMIKDNLILSSKMIDDMITLHLAVYYLGACVNLINHNQKSKYKAEYKRWMHYVRVHLPSLLANSNVSLYRKCMLIGGTCFPLLIAKLDIIRRKRIINNSYN
ncbi:glycosyltransferase family 2 protein [Limosilactobacillus secaliphilus]|uniref:Glycosyltransferase 2-like domain-containing protein n=1 Tax=Limosilactobacillus secaliphilus TaxID=396268 RepID=A0A0R2I0J3_9LACO|nr:glycosyltransferase family A protein [Limosilactobacillus secaliphilus]KRN58363.1 hypothetical protein IV45_GL000809 [Limosilactobacillus secaliphilus]